MGQKSSKINTFAATKITNKQKTTMRKFLLSLTLCVATSLFAQSDNRAPVFITAGQSNADGRAYFSELPDYITQNKYKYVMFDNVTSTRDGEMKLYYPTDVANYFAFDAVTNYWLDQAYGRTVYAVKCTYGGTALDTLARPNTVPIWYAGEDWLSRHPAYDGDATTGRNSLVKSLLEGLQQCVDVTIGKNPDGYDVKAILWHQGESDRSGQAATDYYKNFKMLINYLRQHIYEITGDEQDLKLPFIFGTVPTNSTQYSGTVKNAQKQVAEELENVWYIDLGEIQLKSDNLHLNGPAQEYLGMEMYNLMVEHGLLPTTEKLTTKKPKVGETGEVSKPATARKWEFTYSDKTKTDLAADTEHYNWNSGYGYRYGSSISVPAEMTANGDTIAEAKGLKFRCNNGNRICFHTTKNALTLVDGNSRVIIPGLRAGQTVTIVGGTAKTSEARGIKPYDTDAQLVTRTKGAETATYSQTNSWAVNTTVTEPTDIAFAPTGAYYITSIEVSDPTVQVFLGAEQHMTFSFDQPLDMSKVTLFKAYIAKSYQDGVLAMQQVDTIPANTGIIFKGEESSVEIPIITDGNIAPIENNLLKASVEPTVLNATDGNMNNYTLAARNNVMSFVPVSSSITTDANSAYLQLPVAVGEVKMDFGGTLTAIRQIHNSAKTQDMGKCYTLQGISTMHPQRGIYIVKGKKIARRFTSQ